MRDAAGEVLMGNMHLFIFVCVLANSLDTLLSIFQSSDGTIVIGTISVSVTRLLVPCLTCLRQTTLGGVAEI